jgi:hypothetical protein
MRGRTDVFTRAARIARGCRVAIALIALFAVSCTSVGVHTQARYREDYGPPVTMQVCILQAEGVSDERVEQLVGAVRAEFSQYGIGIEVPWVRPWSRTGFSHKAIYDDMVRRELEAPCDRLVAFVDRNAGDFLWGMALPEVLGSVDDATHTRGFVVANRASLNQLFMPPEKVAVHEFYHLLGCPHSGSLSRCYSTIARLKRAARPGFFPGMDQRGIVQLTREDANRALREAVAVR